MRGGVVVAEDEVEIVDRELRLFASGWDVETTLITEGEDREISRLVAVATGDGEPVFFIGSRITRIAGLSRGHHWHEAFEFERKIARDFLPRSESPLAAAAFCAGASVFV